MAAAQPSNGVLSGLPGHPLWFFILMMGIYCSLLAVVRLTGASAEPEPV